MFVHSSPGPAGGDPAAGVRALIASSPFLQAVAGVRWDGGRAFALRGEAVRPLRPEEIAHLESLGNSADDWSLVRVVDGFDCRAVRHSSFHGEVVLGKFAGRVRVAEGLALPAGIYRSTIVDSVVGHGALVRDVRLLANYVVGEGALLLDCGSVTCEGRTTFGNGAVLSLGVESGGRDVPVYAEIDVPTAAAVAGGPRRRELLAPYRAAVADYAAAAASGRGIIGPGAVLRDTPRVRNTFVGPGARIDAAALVSESTLLGEREDPVEVRAGASVQGALLQGGSRVDTMALVERSVLTEHAHVGGHGRVTSSLLGCNTAVEGGEVTACLLGPFVSLHHQALLIAAFWPRGKGNVSYGANVGSNHTGKAPDQEFWPGEGLFLGLGVNIKYPADFSRAPYTLIACGVTLPPQRVSFPFSLVSTPPAGRPELPPGGNEIIPAWVLTDNLYTVRRCEGKFRARNKARRSRLELAVFRPDVIELMRDARARLEGVGRLQEVYTERDIEGLGKNILLERHRRRAVEAYRFFIRYYALLGLAGRAEAALADEPPGAVARLLVTPSEDGAWEFQRRLLLEEVGVRDPAGALALLPPMLDEVARAVERSKARDDERGARIIPDYAEVHAPADQDTVVRETWEETRRVKAVVGKVLASLLSGKKAVPLTGLDVSAGAMVPAVPPTPMG